MRSIQESVSSKWYQHITDLPLVRFIDCTVDQNLFALVISGKPEDWQLLEAWDGIKLQYADAIKDGEYRLMTTLHREACQLDITHQKILLAIRTLENFYCKEIAAELNKALGSSFKLDVRFPDDYDNDLKRAFNRSKGIFLDLKLKRQAFEAIQSKYKDSETKPTREYFQGLLITLFDHAGYDLPVEKITVFQFAERIRRWNEHHKVIMKKTKKNG